VRSLIDNGLLESIFRMSIEKEYGSVAIELVQKRLYEKYGISLNHAVNHDFTKLEDIVFENFGKGLGVIKTEMLNNIVLLQQNTRTDGVVIVDDQKKVKIIRGILDDDISVQIFDELQGMPKTIRDIESVTGLSNTSLYRKISEMKNVGIITQKGFEVTDQKKISMYVSQFDSIQLVMRGTNFVVHMYPVAERKVSS